ncbi:Oidioi.mRNA.OKI2018_I69.chr2.g5453.t1.cds [Oikopleura dioica]|uniref:Oidioi.mRNA.OKI2018_I69.chr2.g5453.t1.cds n=1 Tax=Oikopleura dioica TaxID=34765 RepID=A0ABN7T6Z3_OIKDI|nr:Oidioi.mRNA.OKI2018_I69.chr2.g5453.t1.cds [Oikopleura dioica]
MKIAREFVVSKAIAGVCQRLDQPRYGRYCHAVTEKMVKLTKEKWTVCLDCFNEYYPDSQHQLVLSDAKLRCPAHKCGVENLSPREFIIGKCCDDAKKMRGKDKGTHALILEQIDELKPDIEFLQAELKKAQADLDSMKASLKDVHAETEEKLGITDEKRSSCKVCLEVYNGTIRQECALQCGHRSCFRCLNSLPRKICPICRKAFTAEQILKLF